MTNGIRPEMKQVLKIMTGKTYVAAITGSYVVVIHS